MYPVLIEFGTFQLRTYGVIVALSFLLGLWLSSREAQRRGLDAGLVQDFAFYALLGGVVGARLYFVIFSNPGYYLERPLEILAVWHGGLGIIGALVGGLVTAVWWCRKKKIRFWALADALAPGVALGQAVGVLACLLNGDSYGKPTSVPWAITYTDPRGMAPLNVPLHPVEIYEMAAYFLVFLVVWATRKRFGTQGGAFLAYLAAYGAARFSVEFFRGHPAMLALGIPAAQVFGVALVLAAGVGYLALRSTRAGA